jgi:hypothetical protein
LSRLASTVILPTNGAHYERHLEIEKHEVSKRDTQKFEREI